MWMGLRSPEIFEYGSLVRGALKTASVVANVYPPLASGVGKPCGVP
jgi:hypothetical protein